MTKIKWPKVGGYVSITWIDSGAAYFRQGVSVDKLKLFDFEEIGRVVRVDKDEIWLAQSANLPKLDEDSDTYSGILKAAIREVKVLK